MPSFKPANQGSFNRREFLRVAGQAGAAALAAPMLNRQVLEDTANAAQSPSSMTQPTASKPNILVVVVDQMRDAQWFPDQEKLDQLLPNIARIRNGSVQFQRHFTAACMCTPSRSVMLTGLYTHQTYVFNTQVNWLDANFPTWGDALRDLGYATWWYGKWHLEDPNTGDCCSGDDLEAYGFKGGTDPDPAGSPAQGHLQDPQIADQVVTWLAGEDAKTTPWCTTVSFVNPHDIMWYPRFTEQIPAQSNPPKVFSQLPANFETPTDLQNHNKPSLQRSVQTGAAQQFGAMRFNGPGFEKEWLEMLDLYLSLQQEVDKQIGEILDALDANPELSQNTIIIFTSDHGEYCGAHGLRGKGGSAYEESIRVPLYVKDPTGAWAKNPDVVRTQLTSSVDFIALLMTLAQGDGSWRSNSKYSHIANRFDMTALLKDPTAQGRDYVLHTTDEVAYEESPRAFWADDPAVHVIAYRTGEGKVATYSHWNEVTAEILSEGQEAECYDYSTENGRIELENVAVAGNTLYTTLNAQLTAAIDSDLRQPLPDSLKAAQKSAYFAYLYTHPKLSHVFLPVVTKD